MAFVSCNEDPEFFTLESHPDEMHIKSSVESVVLNKGIANQEAITFTWDAASSPLSSADEVTYKLCFYPTAMKDDKSDYIDVGTNRTLTLTHDQLNSMVAKWALPGMPVNVTAQVLSNVHNESKYVKPEVSTVEFTATGYEKYPVSLFMTITDDAGNVSSQRLEQRQLGTGIYEVSFNMVPCNFHFTTTAEPYPAYGSAGGDKLEYVIDGNIKEFRNDAVGMRTIIVDTNPEYNDCRVLNIVQLPTPGLIWICGNGCSVGWNTNTSSGRMEMVGTVREPYLYAWTSQPWKTQYWMREIINRMYRPEIKGLGGNDDCGQMSAWYIFSVLGFYPVCPGSDQYVLGAPYMEAARIALPNGNTLEVKASGVSDKNRYVKKVLLRGKEYDKMYITHGDLLAGGTLEFVMSSKPNKSRGRKASDKPYSMTPKVR